MGFLRQIKGTSRQFRWEKWFWAVTMPLGAFWDVMWPKSWNKLGVQIVAQLSIYALVKTCGSQEQAAEAKEIAGDVKSSTEEAIPSP
jgi:hypothetical protein